MKFGMCIEVDEWCTTEMHDPIQDQGQGHEYLKATQEESTVSPACD